MFVTENMKKMSKNGVKMMKIDIVNFLQKIQNAKVYMPGAVSFLWDLIAVR